ncbi:hypothetical protein Hamer_G014928, partial [Homarus americanus]
MDVKTVVAVLTTSLHMRIRPTLLLFMMVADYEQALSLIYFGARTYEPDVSAVVIDGTAAVQMLKPGTTKTLKEYNKAVFEPYIARWLGKVKRVDVLHRGEKVIIITDRKDVVCVEDCVDLSQLASFSHEEIDTRIILHCIDAVSKGRTRILIPAMGQENARTLPMFHAITRCNTLSCDCVKFGMYGDLMNRPRMCSYNLLHPLLEDLLGRRYLGQPLGALWATRGPCSFGTISKNLYQTK